VETVEITPEGKPIVHLMARERTMEEGSAVGVEDTETAGAEDAIKSLRPGNDACLEDIETRNIRPKSKTKDTTSSSPRGTEKDCLGSAETTQTSPQSEEGAQAGEYIGVDSDEEQADWEVSDGKGGFSGFKVSDVLDRSTASEVSLRPSSEVSLRPSSEVSSLRPSSEVSLRRSSELSSLRRSSDHTDESYSGPPA